MQRGKFIGKFSKNGELAVEQGDLHASSWMHSMYSLQHPKDPKTSRMLDSTPGPQADNSPGAQCCSVLNHHSCTDPAQACSPAHTRAQGWPATTCLLQVGVAGALDSMRRTTLQEARHMPGQESRVSPSPGGHCASPGWQTSACRVSVRAQPSPKGGMKLHWKSSPLPSLGWTFPSWKPHMIPRHISGSLGRQISFC